MDISDGVEGQSLMLSGEVSADNDRFPRPAGETGGLPSAVLWDMDGTLVDTEPYWMDCEFALAEKYGGTWSQENALAVVGGDLIESATYMRATMGIDRTPHEIVDELLDGVVVRVQQEVPWRPGARELLAGLRELEVPCALVTMSWRRFAEPILDALPEGSFAAVVCGDEVAHGKPHPEPYLRAAEMIGFAPSDTLAIEDSPTGTTSAVAAGCRVLVVPSHVAVPPGERRVLRASLAGLQPHDLATLHQGLGRPTTS
jgi:HAD superfamily hydrolase (TIGR01509 family)